MTFGRNTMISDGHFSARRGKSYYPILIVQIFQHVLPHSTSLNNRSHGRHALETSPPLSTPSNLLLQLVPLTNLPREQGDINAFYLSSFASPPSSSTPPLKKAKLSKKPTKSGKYTAELDSLPDWMATYDSDPDSDSGPTSSKRGHERTSKLSVHSAIHSIPSHTAVYTQLWIALLGIYLDDSWTRRILVGLHGPRGVLSYMAADKRVRMADWLGGLVDRGGPLGMLAMNGLFVLMTSYNL